MSNIRPIDILKEKYKGKRDYGFIQLQSICKICNKEQLVAVCYGELSWYECHICGENKILVSPCEITMTNESSL